MLDDSDLDSEDKMYLEDEKEAIPEGRDVESSGESDDEPKSLFVNPLAKKAGDESEEWSDDDISADGTKKKSKKGKKDTILGKRKRKGSIDNVQDFFHANDIQEVPLDDPGTRAQ